MPKMFFRTILPAADYANVLFKKYPKVSVRAIFMFMLLFLNKSF
jgi:hypothetical protein